MKGGSNEVGDEKVLESLAIPAFQPQHIEQIHFIGPPGPPTRRVQTRVSEPSASRFRRSSGLMGTKRTLSASL